MNSSENSPIVPRATKTIRRFRPTAQCLPALILATLAACLPSAGRSESPAVRQDEQAIHPVDRRAPFTPKVLSLLAALTLDEKISLAHGAADPTLVGNVGFLPGVPRLGIPVRRDADALGISVVADATALPSRLGIGATFDRSAAMMAGRLAGGEGRALGVDLVYGPHVDLARQPNWTRNNTAYGEDPFLSGELAIQEVEGIQSKGLMSQVKHFTLYNGQAGAGFGTPGEPPLPTVVDDQTAHELYLKAYEYPLTQGHASSVMASYQGFKIVPLQQSAAWAADNALSLETILRGQWQFRGFVLSDYGAVHSVHSILSGLDQEYPGTGLGGLIPSYFATQLKPLVDPTSPSFSPAYAQALDNAVPYVLYAYERFGLLDCASPSGPVTGCKLPARPNINDLKVADAAATERLSEAAAVLLKNEGGVLPLQDSTLQSVAVIGPTGRQVMVSAGQPERARGFPDRNAINTLQVLQALAPAGSHFTYAPGIDWIGSVVPATALAPGLTRTQSGSNATQIDATLDYGPAASSDLTSGVKYTWTGTLTVPATDTYYLWIQQGWRDALFAAIFFGPSVSLSIDGTPTPLSEPGVPSTTYPVRVIPANGVNQGVAVGLAAGPHAIKITAAVPQTSFVPLNVAVPLPLVQPVTFRLAWSRLGETIDAAVAAARSAQVAVVFADDNGAANAELVNSLAANQDALIAAVAKANPNTAVVLSTGDPVLMPWLDDVKAVLEMWYPGQEGGTSTARLLLGRANPGGKLPMTWPASGAQTPFFGHPERISGDGSEVVFSEGLYMGYRWYDQQNITPLFPFGHGLSYAQFAYSALEIRPDSGGLEVSFRLQNTGSIPGSEVPQVYVGAPTNPPPMTQFAQQKLVGFARVGLDAGESERVSIHVSRRELSYWSSAAQRWLLASGERDIHVGASSRDIRLQGRARLDGEGE
jgi:beta-glucosidase